MPVKPLQNITVLDLTRLLPGNYCGMMFADYGARVIKVERPCSPDPVRQFAPHITAGISYWHLLLNRGKESLCLDFKCPAGREAFLGLVKRADVLIESFRTGVMDSMGLGFAALQKINPRLVYCTLSGYGRQGNDLAAHDLNIMGLTGISYYEKTGAPFQGGVQIAGITGALWASFAVMAALQARITTGRGQMVDAPLVNSALAMFPVSMSAYWGELDTGAAMYPRRVPGYCYYQTKDGQYLAVAAREEKFWRRLCEIIGFDMDYAAVSDIKNHPVAFRQLGDIFRQKDRAQWESIFAGENICVTPVHDFREMMDSSLLQDSGMLLNVDEMGGYRQLNCPVRLTDTPGAPGATARRLGADSARILREAGWAEIDIQKLIADGVLRQDRETYK